MPVFFFSDIEDAAEKWERHEDVMGRILTRHDAVLTETIREFDGRIVKHTGEGFFAVFEKGDPLACAIQIQKRLHREDWSAVGDLKVRIAINSGEAEQRGRDFFGPAINRTARLLAAASGGQILLTSAVKDRCPAPEQASFIDLGVHFLPDLGEPLGIYQLVHPDLPLCKFDRLRTLSNRPHNLPAQPTEFVGREREIEEIGAWLRDPGCRLISIVGPGGVGKTRLALQTGALNFERFANGVFFVPLENLAHGSAQILVFTIADALNFNFYRREDPPQQLLDYLVEKEMLLIIDNFERLIAEAGLLSDIVRQAPRVKLLVTSRERLRRHEEHVREIDGLDCPEREDDPDFDGYGAVRLFVQSARSVQPGLALNEDDRRQLVRLLRMVDGVPLCIELAASWMHSATCAEIVQELEKSMDFLDSTVQDLPKRHRNLRAVFEYSWELLAEKDRTVFRKAGVFGAPFSSEAANQVCGIGPTDLAAMVDKSLLRRRPDGRYEMFPLLRQYAEEKLVQAPEDDRLTRERHVAYYSDLFGRLAVDYCQGREDVFVKSFAGESENGRQAFDYAVDHDLAGRAGPIIAALHFFYEMKGWLLESERLLNETQDKLVLRHGTDPAAGPGRAFLALILRLKGAALRCLAQYDRARDCLVRAQELLSGARSDDAALILGELGMVANRTGDYGRARSLFRESLGYWEEKGDRRMTASLMYSLGSVDFENDEMELAKGWYEKGLGIMREIGSQRGIATGLSNLGNVNYGLTKLAEAGDCHRQALEIRRAINDRSGLSTSCNNLGLVLAQQGKREAAIEHYNQALAIKKEMGDQWGICNTLLNIATVYRDLGNPDEARVRYRAAFQVLTRIKAQPLAIQAINRVAGLYQQEGKKEKAIELWAFIADCPVSDESRRREVRNLLAAYPAPEVDSAAKKTAAWTIESVVQGIVREL